MSKLIEATFFLRGYKSIKQRLRISSLAAVYLKRGGCDELLGGSGKPHDCAVAARRN
jgi:hypothetical protein